MGAETSIWDAVKYAGKEVVKFFAKESTKEAVKEAAVWTAKEAGKAAIVEGTKAVASKVAAKKANGSQPVGLGIKDKEETAEDLAKQRERERVRALSSAGLLGGNTSVLGGWGDTSSPSSRSSLLGN